MGLYVSLMVLDFELFLVILLTTYSCFDAGLAIWLVSHIRLKLGLSFPFVACLVSDVGVLFSLCCLLYSPQSDF